MPILMSPDGRIMFAIETAGEGDGNSVVYYDGVAVWDRFSYEREHGIPPPNPVQPSPPTVVPSPPTGPVVPLPPPSPIAGGLRRIRVTGPEDGEVLNRTYPYWPAVFLSGDSAYVFAAKPDHPVWFGVDLPSGNVRRLGPLIRYPGTGEGWFFDKFGRITLPVGPQIRRVNPFNEAEDEVVLDISGSYPGCNISQVHSSEDGNTHSGTVVDPRSWTGFATVVLRNGRWHDFPSSQQLDESAIDASGRWLVIKEGNDNRIIDLETGGETFVTNAQGALGHSDLGWGIAVGEDDQQGGAVFVELGAPAFPARLLHHTWNMGTVSIRGGRCLLANPVDGIGLVDMANGGFHHLWDHQMVVGPGDSYEYQVHAGWDPTGRAASFVTNHGGGRMDVDLLIGI